MDDENKWKCFWYCYHFSTIIEPLSFLTSKTLLLLFLQNSYFWMFSSTFNFLLIFYFEYLLLANTILHLTYCFWFSTINGFVVFHYVGEFLFFFFFKKPCYIYINKPNMQILSSRGLPPNECSANVQKVVEKIYLWVNSFLRTLNSFAKVYESKNSLLGGSQKFISSDFYMKSKILSMKPKSLKLWTHTKQRINLAIRKSK